MAKARRSEIDELSKEIEEQRPGTAAIETELSTSDRVLRRVTDGIYREPWSALRELVSNAYDADATEVVIDTDAPRFAEIRVRDNGAGFTTQALASMIKSIGGSPKRTWAGARLGVTDPDDPSLSPEGRKLIGKLGIGLFAVSQLTKQFQVITKREGDDFRTAADVILSQYAEEDGGPKKDQEDKFVSGRVKIWKVPARDRDSHGTEVHLRDIWPRTRAELASRDTWAMVRGPTDDGEGDESAPRPLYHIGCVDPKNPSDFAEEPHLPWGDETDPDARFSKFAGAMFGRESDVEDRRPSLENTFDNYLTFVWRLSLAAPLDYLSGHPFDLTADAGMRFFRLGNSREEAAEELKLGGQQSVRKALKLKAPERGTAIPFRVLVDGVSLKRPIRFVGLPKSSHSVDRPILLVGKDKPDLDRYPEEIRGGSLAFEAYLLWCPRVVPVEHNGVLIRIHDASGALFDSTFMDYKVSEQTRLRQVSAEIFVSEGLDAALDIDRESFNASHPHYQYLAMWVHNAFRQFATRHKGLAKEARERRRTAEAGKAARQLEEVVAAVVDRWSGGDESPVEVDLAPAPGRKSTKRRERLAYDLRSVLVELMVGPGKRVTTNKAAELLHREAILTGVAQVLYASGVFDRLNHAKQELLLADLARVIFHRGNK